MYKSSRQEFSYNNISYNNNKVIITILQHIQNTDTFNAWNIFKTVLNI